MIENTSGRDPLLHLIGAMDGRSNFIEDMEAEGQRQFVHSDRIPTELHDCTEDDLIALGFVLGDPDPGDKLFRAATLPAGWSRAGSDHAMWSYLLDGNGRQRAAVFYKAAFYDRRAFLRLANIHSEMFRLLSGQINSPVIDDWTPRDAWIKALTGRRDAVLREADEFAVIAYDDGVKRRRAEAVLCDRHLAALGVA